MLLHRGVEARSARSEGMRDREACSQASSNAKRRREQSSEVSRQWISRAPETRSVAVTERPESQHGDRISMWKARRNGVIFAWKRGSQASSLRENGSFGLSSSDASGGGANLTTKRVPRETVDTSLRASVFRLAMNGGEGPAETCGSNRSARTGDLQKKAARPEAEVLSSDSTRPIGCRRSIVIC